MGLAKRMWAAGYRDPPPGRAIAGRPATTAGRPEGPGPATAAGQLLMGWAEDEVEGKKRRKDR